MKFTRNLKMYAGRVFLGMYMCSIIQLSSGHYYLYRYEKLINKLLNVCNLYTPHNEVVGGYTGFTMSVRL
jgi:hypothetical protein